MKQTDMFQDEIKTSRIKAVAGKAKFWGRKAKTTAEEIAENEVVREIGTATKDVTVEAIKSPPMRFVIGGMICGALIGTLIPIPFVGTAAGATAGAIIGLWKWFTQA